MTETKPRTVDPAVDRLRRAQRARRRHIQAEIDYAFELGVIFKECTGDAERAWIEEQVAAIRGPAA